MKEKVLIVVIAALVVFYTIKIARADIQVDSIVADLKDSTATIKEEIGSTVNGVFQPSGETQTIYVTEPAYDQVIGALQNSNALNLNAIVNIVESTTS